MIEKYHIQEDFKQLFDVNDSKDSGKIETYISEISQFKGQKNEKLLANDAKNIKKAIDDKNIVFLFKDPISDLSYMFAGLHYLIKAELNITSALS